MKKKIVVFHPALATYRVDFFNELDSFFNADFYFDLKEQSSHSHSDNYLQSKCTFESKYFDSGFKLFGRYFRFGVGSILKKTKPEIVICSEYNPVTLLVFFNYLITKRFKLYTISDDNLIDSNKRKGLRLWLRNIISKNIDGIIFHSEVVCDWYRNEISMKPKTLVLPIIHNDDVFRSYLFSSVNNVIINLNKYRLINKKTILYVGRLAKEKNLTALVNAVSFLTTTDWRLVIVGDGLEEEFLKKQVSDLELNDNIIFVGRLEGKELYSWYNIADIFVLPSIFEAYGAVVNEALLAGCYVLCSEIAGAATLINKKNGMLFNPENEEQLSKMLTDRLTKVDLPNKEINKLRQNMMPFTFKEKVKTLLENL